MDGLTPAQGGCLAEHPCFAHNAVERGCCFWRKEYGRHSPFNKFETRAVSKEDTLFLIYSLSGSSFFYLYEHLR